MSDLSNPIFHDETKAREWLEARVWANGRVCPHCGVVDQSTLMQGKTTRPGLYQCNACREPFTVTVGTLYERTKVPLHKWLAVTHLMMASKKGMSALADQPHDRPAVQDGLVSLPSHPRVASRYARCRPWAAKTRSWKPTKPMSAAKPRTALQTPARAQAGRFLACRARRPCPLVPHCERDREDASPDHRKERRIGSMLMTDESVVYPKIGANVRQPWNGESFRRRICAPWRLYPHQHGRKLFQHREARDCRLVPSRFRGAFAPLHGRI